MRLGVLLLVGLIGCGSEESESGVTTFTDAGGPMVVGGGCVEGIGQCVGLTFQRCRGGAFVDEAVCEISCAPGFGCGECSPATGQVCVGEDLHVCKGDGSIGDRMQICAGGCERDRCNASDDCSEESRLIYVVDSDSDLLSFDPRTNAFSRVGVLDCPSGQNWPEWGPGMGRPFSMSVDRGGRAWVLYTSGEIFWVDIRTAACERSDFMPGDGNFQLFGMGFVTDEPGGSEETLHIAGGPVNFGVTTLATINPSSRRVEPIGLVLRGDFGPELTGNGNAELWGYFSGAPAAVAHLDKSSGGDTQRWLLEGFADRPSAWAFAHWGGRYYIFITTRDAAGAETPRVLRFDPGTGMAETVVERHEHRVVGAGVSTCAPTEVVDF